MIKELAKKVMQRFGYRLIKDKYLQEQYRNIKDPQFRNTGNLDPLEQLFYKYIHDDFFFIQIGANDGKRHDPIHHLIAREKAWVRGVALEPVKEYFEELKETYKDFPGIYLLQKAIHNSQTEATIYKINPEYENIGEHLKGMSAFDIRNFTKDGIAEKDILAEKVPCTSIVELVNTEEISKIHLLQIDAEGYDIEIIKSIDFAKLKPLIINFEHRWHYNLTPENELFEVFKILIDNGYKLILNGNDALAYI
jgi:FkbM family methyltransferase